MPRKVVYIDLGKAILIWLGLGLSLGWYYTFTYYGRSGWPMPLPEPLVACILYYFSVLNVATEFQAVHWMLVFPLAGLLWGTTLAVTAPFFGGRRVDYSWTLYRLSLTSLPLLLPIPLGIWLAGHTTMGFSVQRMVNVALRRGFVTPPQWLTPIFIGLAAAAMVWQLFMYAKVFDLRGKKAALHLLVGAIVTLVFACGLATLAAFPLRYFYLM